MFFFQIVLTDVPGTGRDGRILKEDIMRYIDGMKTVAAGTKIECFVMCNIFVVLDSAVASQKRFAEKNVKHSQ